MGKWFFFSRHEEYVMEVLNRHRRVLSIREITEKVCQKHVDFTDSVDAQNRVAALVRRINMKCNFHKLDWFINSYGTGRAGKFVWKDKRK